jgi:hypothetical protein
MTASSGAQLTMLVGQPHGSVLGQRNDRDDIRQRERGMPGLMVDRDRLDDGAARHDRLGQIVAATVRAARQRGMHQSIAPAALLDAEHTFGSARPEVPVPGCEMRQWRQRSGHRGGG